MTSAFLDTFIGEQQDFRDGRPVWRTIVPLRYRSALARATVQIPPDFITDLASVPRWPVLWLTAGGCGIRPAVVHDFAYAFGWWPLADDRRLVVSKDLADAVFHEALLADPLAGVGDTRAWLMHKAVVIGGTGVWANARRTADLNPVWTRAGWPAHTEAP